MNYRKKFEQHYGIKLSKEYEVHHIDLDRNNNDISNLLILPKKLHKEYHACLNSINTGKEKHKICFDARIYGNSVSTNSYQMVLVKRVVDVLSECSIWYDYKMYLDGKVPNMHNIKLE